ncbi:MAG: hypothetical protein OXG82_05720 [Gammaproteobacteria bacterium]|nr:hypothetical protein [Gammaproteobacteria bacterium]
MRCIVAAFQRPVAPALGTWLVGLAAFSVVSVERLFSAPHAAFVYARLSAYIATVTVAALTVALIGVFGLACGVMLRWLDDPISPRRIAACAGRSFWTVAAYTWIALALLVVDPPSAIAVADLWTPESVQSQMRGVLAYRWLSDMRVAVLAAYLIAVVVLLQRHARLVNVAIAVGFGAGLVAALLTALGVLGGGRDF